MQIITLQRLAELLQSKGYPYPEWTLQDIRTWLITKYSLSIEVTWNALYQQWAVTIQYMKSKISSVDLYKVDKWEYDEALIYGLHYALKLIP